MTPREAVRVVGLNKAYGSNRVLCGVDLAVASGETVAVVGPSGCGKTTLLRLIAGLDGPDAGQVYLDNRLASRRDWILAPHRRGIGFLFQEPALWPHMTALQNVLFALRRWPRAEAMGRARALLERMGIPDLAGRYPDQLSGGQARRIALARALAARPDVLLLDEPLTSLDAALKDELMALLRQESGQAAVVLVTHDRGEAESLAQALYVLEGVVLVRAGLRPGVARSTT